MVYNLILPLFPFTHCIYSVKDDSEQSRNWTSQMRSTKKELQNILLLKVFEHLVLKQF